MGALPGALTPLLLPQPSLAPAADISPQALAFILIRLGFAFPSQD